MPLPPVCVQQARTPLRQPRPERVSAQPRRRRLRTRRRTITDWRMRRAPCAIAGVRNSEPQPERWRSWMRPSAERRPRWTDADGAAAGRREGQRAGDRPLPTPHGGPRCPQSCSASRPRPPRSCSIAAVRAPAPCRPRPACSRRRLLDARAEVLDEPLRHTELGVPEPSSGCPAAGGRSSSVEAQHHTVHRIHHTYTASSSSTTRETDANGAATRRRAGPSIPSFPRLIAPPASRIRRAQLVNLARRSDHRRRRAAPAAAPDELPAKVAAPSAPAARPVVKANLRIKAETATRGATDIPRRVAVLCMSADGELTRRSRSRTARRRRRGARDEATAGARVGVETDARASRTTTTASRSGQEPCRNDGADPTTAPVPIRQGTLDRRDVARMSGPTGRLTASTPRGCGALSNAACAVFSSAGCGAGRRAVESAPDHEQDGLSTARGDDAGDLVVGAANTEVVDGDRRRSRPRAGRLGHRSTCGSGLLLRVRRGDVAMNAMESGSPWSTTLDACPSSRREPLARTIASRSASTTGADRAALRQALERRTSPRYRRQRRDDLRQGVGCAHRVGSLARERRPAGGVSSGWPGRWRGRRRTARRTCPGRPRSARAPRRPGAAVQLSREKIADAEQGQQGRAAQIGAARTSTRLGAAEHPRHDLRPQRRARRRPRTPSAPAAAAEALDRLLHPARVQRDALEHRARHGRGRRRERHVVQGAPHDMVVDGVRSPLSPG